MEKDKNESKAFTGKWLDRHSNWTSEQVTSFNILCSSWSEIMADCFHLVRKNIVGFYRQEDRFLDFMSEVSVKNNTVRYETEFADFVEGHPEFIDMTKKEFGQHSWHEHLGHSYTLYATTAKNSYQQTRASLLVLRYIAWMKAPTKHRFMVSLDDELNLTAPEAHNEFVLTDEELICQVKKHSLSKMLSCFLRDVTDFQHQQMIRAMLTIMKRAEHYEYDIALFTETALARELEGFQFEWSAMKIYRNRDAVLRRFAAFLIAQNHHESYAYKRKDHWSVLPKLAVWCGLGHFIKRGIVTDATALQKAAEAIYKEEPIRKKFNQLESVESTLDTLREYCQRAGIVVRDVPPSSGVKGAIAQLSGFPNGKTYPGKRSPVFVYESGVIYDFHTNESVHLRALVALSEKEAM